MKFFSFFTNSIRKVLPSPFSIAIILTFLTIILALFFTKSENEEKSYFIQVIGFWEMGFWELLEFSMQMMLILVLGHVLALTRVFNSLIRSATVLCNNTANAAFTVTLLTILVSYLNWGLGLIFGAIFSRKVAEYALEKGIKINYPVIGASGYAGLMVWHGGLSGSAPLIIAQKDHFLIDQTGVIPVNETIFSPMNMMVFIAILVFIPLVMYLIGKRSESQSIEIEGTADIASEIIQKTSGAEKMDHSKIFTYFFSFLIIGYGVYKAFITGNLSVLNLNYINFILFGLGLLLHGTIFRFIKAVNSAIIGASGIFLQFPLYAGIMGIMKYSGLFLVFTEFFIQISNEQSFPVFTFFSASIVNIFVPSGGGQWAVQGPVIVEAASQLGASIPKSVMALAYGDQLTNMLQPFWALPLLGITGLKARDIIPYTFILMLAGMLIFIVALIL
ncbi:short-chain fatty acid transporter [Bacteroidota bacterium]